MSELADKLEAAWRDWIDGGEGRIVADENRADFADKVHVLMPAILAALRPVSDEGWQPIETAPRDESEFLAYCEEGDFWLAHCQADGSVFTLEYGTVENGVRGFVSCIIAWQPLPDPPTGSVGGEGR